VSFPRPTVRKLAGAVMTATMVMTAVIGTSGNVAAHEGIESSVPASGSTVAEPISSVTIDFGAVIGANTELGLVDPDGNELPSTTTVTSDTTAEVTFEPITAHGTYAVNYLAPSVVDGHLIVGSITFSYGTVAAGAPGPAVLPWVLFGIAAVVILGIGAWFSLQRHRRSALPADEPELVG
jgi:methionine-rich copper-binding protein CopC